MTATTLSIIDAIKDRQLFRPFLQDANGDISTWHNWMAALRVLYGIGKVPNKRRQVVEQCTGRQYATLPKRGFDSALFLTGRRSGKSRVAAIIGAFEAAIADTHGRLAKGETGIVAICSPTKLQSRIVKSYLRSVFETPLLKDYVDDETREGFTLKNSARVELLSGDFRTIRGYTLLAAIVDEVAFMGLDEQSHVKSDTELIRAIRPALATTRGKLIAITSPYAKKGWCYSTYKKNFGNDAGRVLVWNSPSKVMNSTLPQSVIDDAMAEDMASARAEFGGEFRADISNFIDRALVERLVIPGRWELLPKPGIQYSAFVDMSGGVMDDAVMAVGHAEGRKVIVDRVYRYKPRFNPHDVIRDMAEQVKHYGVRRVTGDQYAAEFTAQAFASCGIGYIKADLPKSGLYLELLHKMTANEIELLDDETTVNQISSLERRTRSGGKDSIDHPPGGHDDLANAIAGCAVVSVKKTIRIGGLI